MHGNFFDAFGKNASENRIIPEDILQELNKNLPENFAYVRREDGSYDAVLNPHSPIPELVINCEFDFEKEPDLEKTYSKIGYKKFTEYLFRIQKAMPVKNVKMGSSEKLESLGRLTADPFSDEECEILDPMIYPAPFESPYILHLESPEGDIVDLQIQQVAYNSLTEIKKSNINFPALKFEIYQYKPLIDQDVSDTHTNANQKTKIEFSVIPDKAKSVHDVVIAFHIFRGLLNGSTKINGKEQRSAEHGLLDDAEQMKSSMTLWESALKLEEKLNVSFDPSIKLSREDSQLFAELDLCMLQGKFIKWKHPFDHFHVDEFFDPKNGQHIRDYIGSSEKLTYAFIEGPMPTTLMGANFDLYSISTMEGFIITNIEWDENKGGEIYISDSGDTPWILSRHYCTLQEAKEFNVTVKRSGVSSFPEPVRSTASVFPGIHR